MADPISVPRHPSFRSLLEEHAATNVLCQDGPVLRWLQLNGTDEDPKDLVDRPQRSTAEDLLCAFGGLHDVKPHEKWPAAALLEQQVPSLLERHFASPGETVEVHQLLDTPRGSLCFVTRTQRLTEGDKDLATKSSNGLASLGRSWSVSKAANFKADSHIPLPHPFVVPGGRFRELYYWDSYWIFRGLILCGMLKTATNILKNFAFLIDTHGFVPNASRVYYLDRSQPPLFFAMVDSHFRATQDFAMLRRMLHRVAREYSFWMTQRAVTLAKGELGTWEEVENSSSLADDDKNHHVVLNRYSSFSSEPRPESYRVDYKLRSEKEASFKEPQPEKVKALMRDIRATAESGWDFSSRWMRPSTTGATEDRNSFSLLNLRTTQVLPVDLNSMLYLMEVRLAEWCNLLSTGEGEIRPVAAPGSGSPVASAEAYATAAQRRARVLKELMYCEETHTWHDYLLDEQKRSDVLSVAGLWPVWAGLMDDTPEELRVCASAFVNNQRLWTPKGIACTTLETGQQWDYPNTWPPLAQMALETLLTKSVGEETRARAKEMVRVYLDIFQRSLFDGKGFYEKYSVADTDSATKSPMPGGGGEYPCQRTFAWTMAVALEFLYWKAMDFDLGKDEFLGRPCAANAPLEEEGEGCDDE